MMLASIAPAAIAVLVLAAVAVVTALVLRKNPKIASDVNVAVGQVAALPAKAVAAEKSVAASVAAVEKKV